MITAVHIITRLDLGGAQENTLASVEGLRERGINASLLYGPGGFLDAEAQTRLEKHAIAVPELVHPLRPHRDPLGYRALKKALSSLQAQHEAAGGSKETFLVHTHSSKAGVLGRLAAHKVGAAKVVHGIHGFAWQAGQHSARKKAYVYAERYVGSRTHAFTSVSENCLEEARQLHIIHDWHRTRVVRSGMDLQPFLALGAADRTRARRELALPEEAPIVLSIANLKPQKDPLTMIRAFRTVVDQIPNARLLYAGDGPLRRKTEGEILKLGLEDHVRLLGWTRTVPTLVAAADVVALSSLFEGLPRSAVQAVAAQRPFVGTRVNGTPEIIRDGKNGHLVEPGSPAALAQAICQSLRSPRVDPTDRERVLAWSTDAMVESQATFYDELIQSTVDRRL